VRSSHSRLGGGPDAGETRWLNGRVPKTGASKQPTGAQSVTPDSAAASNKPRVTIRQIAALAGVSVATASRALNGRDDVSSETRLAVKRVARAHGYGVRSRAQHPGVDSSRPARWSGIVGVTMPYPGPAYFAEILAGAVEALSDRDMRALVCPTRHQRKQEISLVEELVRGETDGAVLVLPEESPDELRAVKHQGFNFVVVDPLSELDGDIPVVSTANTSGAHQATAHLLELGHRRIGVITGRGLASQRRLMGYHAALVAAGVMPDRALEVEGDYLAVSGAAGANQLLDLPEPPTAIFAFNDSMAVGALQTARARGRQVPEDLSIVGFDDTIEADVAYPPLTTVRQPLKELGSMAVNLLFRLLAQEWSEPLHVELATRLIVRASTMPPAPESH
jgi:LacI family transcriptional regulator